MEIEEPNESIEITFESDESHFDNEDMATEGSVETTIATVIAPRVGGVIDGTPWTGGPTAPEAKKLSKPKGILCFRPPDYKSKQRQYDSLVKGLDDRKHLELTGAKDDKQFSVVSWIREIRLVMEMRGLDSVFRITSTDGQSELYLLESWGEADFLKVKNFVEHLQETGDDFDRENLDLSGEIVRKSLGPDLFDRVALKCDTMSSGPVYFKAAIDELLFMNATMVRKLSNQLGNLKLKDVDGENVDKLGDTVTTLVKEITGSGQKPGDLLNLVSQPFTTGTCEGFRAHAMAIDSQVMSNTYTGTWNQLIDQHKAVYRDLVQTDRYPPAQGGKKDPDSVIQAMIAQKIDEKLEQLESKRSGPSASGGKKYNRTNKTEKRSGEKNWRVVPPKKDESREKTVDGVLYKWCGKCRGGDGFWNGGDKAHLTDEHRSRSELQASSPPKETQANLGHINEPLSFGFFAYPKEFCGDL